MRVFAVDATSKMAETEIMLLQALEGEEGKDKKWGVCQIGRNSVLNVASRRLTILRRTVIVDTQKIREKALLHLEELFELAVKIAKGEVKTQMVDGKRVKVTL